MYRRELSKTNFKGISDEIKQVDWDSTLNGLGIEEAYTTFLSLYQNLWKEHVPLKRISNGKKRNEWMSKETLDIVRLKHKLWYKIRSDIVITKYRRKCVDLTRSIRKDKMKCES